MNAAEGWHNSLNSHFGTPPESFPALVAEVPVSSAEPLQTAGIR